MLLFQALVLGHDARFCIIAHPNETMLPNYPFHLMLAKRTVVDLISYCVVMEVRGRWCTLKARTATFCNAKERSPLPIHPLARCLSEEVHDHRKISQVAGAFV